MTSKQCPQCFAENEAVAGICSACKYNFFSLKPKWEDTSPSPSAFNQTNVFVAGGADSFGTRDVRVGSFRQILGIAGSVVLFLGVFTPIVSVPIAGSFNYFRNGTGDGVIIIILAAVSAILAFRQEFKGLVIAGALSLGMLAFTFINFHYRMNEARSAVDRSNPFSGISDAMIDMVQIEWGWAVLIFGSFMLIAAGLLKHDSFQVSVSTNR